MEENWRSDATRHSHRLQLKNNSAGPHGISGTAPHSRGSRGCVRAVPSLVCCLLLPVACNSVLSGNCRYGVRREGRPSLRHAGNDVSLSVDRPPACSSDTVETLWANVISPLRGFDFARSFHPANSKRVLTHALKARTTFVELWPHQRWGCQRRLSTPIVPSVKFLPFTGTS